MAKRDSRALAVAPPRGVPGRKKKTAISPHAPIDPLDDDMRLAAVHGGISDDKGNATEEEQRAFRDAKRRVNGRKPAVMIAKSEEGRRISPTGDAFASHMRMLDTFGTRSDFFMARQMHEIECMVARIGEDGDHTSTAVNSALAIVSAIAPTNEIEAALAVQMAGTHTLSCEMAARIVRNDNIERMNTYVNAASKLQRTFLAQLDALDRLRGKGQQTVRVEHVTVAPGGQAIVGDIHHYPHLPPQDPANAPALGTEERAALPSPDPIRQTLPGARDEEWAMQDAWREEHWRAEG